MNIRKKRQEIILDLIDHEMISTQEELLKKLCEHGFEVTQATVSRDIKDLKLVKKVGPNGKSIYTNTREHTSDFFTKYYAILSESVISVDYALNTCVIKCYVGLAQAACAALDSMEWEGVVGTLAGDDTIFVLCRTPEAASQLKESIEIRINI